MIRVILVSFSFVKGGAAIAASNFFNLVIANPSFEVKRISQDRAGFFQFFMRLVSFSLSKLQIDNNPTKHSLNLFSYSPLLESFVENRNAVFHLHWINNDTLSVWDFDKIPYGSILTLHDEWIYCGAEHYFNYKNQNLEFVTGYSRKNGGVTGINWNFVIWKKKHETLKGRGDLIFTVPSNWMLERAKKSLILKDSLVLVLPNPIDTKVFSPADSKRIFDFRSTFDLVSNDIIISFGAIGGTKNNLKGSFLLMEALGILENKLTDQEKGCVKLVSFGGDHQGRSCIHGFSLISIGHIKEKSLLALLYSSSDFVVVPSIVESFGQIAAEALSTETPVVCFKTSGLLDIVEDSISGYMAEPFSPSSLAEKIQLMLRASKAQRKKMGKDGRKHVLRKFSPEVISIKYQEVITLASKIKSKHLQ